MALRDCKSFLCFKASLMALIYQEIFFCFETGRTSVYFLLSAKVKKYSPTKFSPPFGFVDYFLLNIYSFLTFACHRREKFAVFRSFLRFLRQLWLKLQNCWTNVSNFPFAVSEMLQETARGTRRNPQQHLGRIVRRLRSVLHPTLLQHSLQTSPKIIGRVRASFTVVLVLLQRFRY